ncbi:MAG: hypothetical protein SGILL_004815 [Bacillariaceae sp.]
MPFLVSDPPKKTTNSPKKGRRPSRSVDQAKIKSPGLETSDTEDSDCDDDKSLDPSALLQKSVSKSHKLSDSRHRSNTSCHGSNRGQNSHEFNKSLDLSSHGGFRNKQGDINTSASDDQWARFKLLGRIGLGEIQPSEAAKLLIRQNVRVLSGIIKRVVALRDEDEDILEKSMHGHSVEIKTGNLLSEVRETLEVKKTRARYKRDPESIRLGRKVLSELEDFVTHASTVLSNVNRVVSLCEAPDDIDYTDIRFITTDPWTHFALTFTALIHDVDHSGVPNAQLIKEGSHVASAYKNKSIAEQNSLEISWSLLMEPAYRNLRDCLFVNPEELTHFRSMVVTATLATDIADKELAAMRKDRAAEALAVLEEEGPTTDDIASLKATFGFEKCLQTGQNPRDLTEQATPTSTTEESSLESSFNSSGFLSFGDVDSDSEDEDEEKVNEVINNAKTYLSSTHARFKTIQREKNEEYKQKLERSKKSGNASVQKTLPLSSQSERACRTVNFTGGSGAAGRPIKRIVYKSKATPQAKVDRGEKEKKKGQSRQSRSKTAVPDGQQRYKMRSKSASCDRNALSDNEALKSMSPKRRKKKKRRSKSLGGSGHKKSMKGKRPGKPKQKTTET